MGDTQETNGKELALVVPGAGQASTQLGEPAAGVDHTGAPGTVRSCHPRLELLPHEGSFPSVLQALH